jgi:uncharacterized membrane protein YgcG
LPFFKKLLSNILFFFLKKAIKGTEGKKKNLMELTSLLGLSREETMQKLSTMGEETALVFLRQVVRGVLHGEAAEKALADGLIVDMLADVATIPSAEDRLRKWRHEVALQRDEATRHLEHVDGLNAVMQQRSGREDMMRRASAAFFDAHAPPRSSTGADAVLSQDAEWLARREPLFWTGVVLADLPVLKRAAVVHKVSEVLKQHGRASVPDSMVFRCDSVPAPKFADLRSEVEKKNFAQDTVNKNAARNRRAGKPTTGLGLAERLSRALRKLVQKHWRARRGRGGGGGVTGGGPGGGGGRRGGGRRGGAASQAAAQQ